MDALSQLVGTLRLQAALYTHFDVSAPWGHRVTHRGQVKFVLVARGACWVRSAAHVQPLELQTGDLFLVLDGAPYSVSDQPNGKCIDCAKLEPLRTDFRIRYGGGGATTSLVSVAMQLAPDDTDTLLRALPPFIHLRLDAHRSHAMRALADLLRDEIANEGLGATPIVRRLAETLFISAIRAYVEAGDVPKEGLLAALADPKLRRAIGEMQDDIAFPWTVEALAGRAGMSRASFAAKFRSTVGVPPLDYLTQHRITEARVLLREGLSLDEVASRVGYDSSISFARAFRRLTGTPPGAFRREARSA